MMTRLRRDERGFTLVEMLVATAMGMVVILIISFLAVLTLRESSRVEGRVNATQDGRIVMYEIMDDLHSACIAPQIAPIQAGSTGSSLNFIHQRGIAVAPTPVLSKVTLTGNSLTEANFANTGGAAPNWTFATTASTTKTLDNGVSAQSVSVPIFRYYAYSGGAVSATPLTVPLSATDAARTVQVTVTMIVAPGTASVVDANGAVTVQDTAFLRFTSPSFDSGATNLPCQ